MNQSSTMSLGIDISNACGISLRSAHLFSLLWKTRATFWPCCINQAMSISKLPPDSLSTCHNLNGANAMRCFVRDYLIYVGSIGFRFAIFASLSSSGIVLAVFCEGVVLPEIVDLGSLYNFEFTSSQLRSITPTILL